MRIDFSTKTFGLISLGCDKNRVDSEKLLAIIKTKGGKITSDCTKAQIIIVNTCAFLNSARKESIETVLEYSVYKNQNLEKLVVCGCLPQKFINETFPALTEGDVFLGTNDYDRFFDALEKSYTGCRVNFVGCGSGATGEDRVISTPEHYAYLKIADGCNNRCTYCLIPKIRGSYISYPMDRLISETESLGDISELVLVAQDITRYGTDLCGKSMLVELLKKLTALENVGSVRLLYCYPDMIDGELIAEIRDNPKIIKYLDIPLQHSEDAVLKLMNRKGCRAEYLNLLKVLRENIPEIAVRSTFIAGFPGETEEQFEGLKDFLRQAQIDNCGFFAYSREPDTPAYKLKNQLPYAVKRKRVKELYSFQNQISAQKLSRYVGKSLKVLCDGIDYDRGCFKGRAYFQAPDIDGAVYFNADFAEQGKYYEIIIEKSDSCDLYGRTADFKGNNNE